MGPSHALPAPPAARRSDIGLRLGPPTAAGRSARRAPRPAHRAFTLIEVMVVLAIVAILATIALVVAGKVTDGGKARLTESVIRIMDSTVDAYMSDKEGKVPAYFEDQHESTFPLIDGRKAGEPQDEVMPSTTLYLLFLEDVPSAQQSLKGLDARLLSAPKEFTTQVGQPEAIVGGAEQPLLGRELRDAWGKPIRFVHPKFHGGYGPHVDQPGRDLLRGVKYKDHGGDQSDDFSRSARPAAGQIGEADEGMCPGGRPYFYSVGPDGDPGSRSDNVYTNKPQFPAETTEK